MNGAASGLIEATKYAAGSGDGWASIPYGGNSWFKYGSAGINCWGTLCGVPNGCCAFLNLCGLYTGALGDKVLGYYSQTSFPTSAVCDAYGDGWTGPEPIPDEDVLAHTVSDSPLCHVSISKWCDAAGVSLASTDGSRSYKQDRCGKICADMAAFTAELINGTAAYTFEMNEDAALCATCHTKSSIEAPAQCGKMDCMGCHTGEAVIVGTKHYKGHM